MSYSATRSYAPLSPSKAHTAGDPVLRDSTIPLQVDRAPRRAKPSVGLRWAVAVGSLVLVATVLLGWISLDQQQRNLETYIDLFGRSMAAQLAGAAADPLFAQERQPIESLLRDLPKNPALRGAAIVRDAAIKGTGGRLIADGLVPSDPQNVPASGVLDWEWMAEGGKSRRARSYWAPIRFLDMEAEAGQAVVTLDADMLDRSLMAALSGTLLASAVLIPITVGAGVLLGRRLARPLQTLAALSRRAEAGAQVRMPQARGDKEIDRIVQAFNRLAEGVRERDRLEQTLNRRVPVPLTRRLHQDPVESSVTHTVTIDGSVLFCDVTGFTALAEPLPPDRVVALLNEYYLYITSAAESCGGVVDSFIGDCVMVVFGDASADPLHALHAATCALLIRDTVARVNERRAVLGQAPVRFRIGVNSGPMALCEIGGTQRSQVTVIGDTVNVAARLCGLGRPGEITLGEHTASGPEVAARLKLIRLPRHPVRGREQAVTPFRVDALTDDHQGQLLHTLNRILPHETT
jgi:adenylate cyclase